MRRNCWILALILICFADSFSQDVNYLKVGLISGIKGTARLKQLPKGNEIILHSNNFARSLKSGEQLKPHKNGKVYIRLCDKKDISVSGDGWFKVPYIICPSSNLNKKRELRKSFSTAGRFPVFSKLLGTPRKNSIVNIILFPAKFEEEEEEYEITIIRPETVLFRWEQTLDELTFSLKIKGKDEIIWEQKNVNGKDGYFTSSELKNTLNKIREKQPEAILEFKIQSPSGKEYTALFRIFSLENEKLLQQELDEVKTEKGFLLHYERAKIFEDYQLYIEAADEYEKALKFSSESIELLRITAAIQNRAGNPRRGHSHYLQIEKLETVK